MGGGEAGGFADALTHVGQEIAADFAASGDFDFGDERAVEEEALFNPDAARDFADGEAGGVGAEVLGVDDGALKHLDAFFLALFDFLVDFDGVASLKGDYGALLAVANLLN